MLTPMAYCFEKWEPDTGVLKLVVHTLFHGRVIAVKLQARGREN